MEKILVRGPDVVGGFVLATPFYRELRKNFPKAKITLLIKPLVYELAKDCSCVNEVKIYGSCNNYQLIKWLRQEKFNVAYLLSGSFSSALSLYLGKIKELIGYSHDWRGIFLTKVIPDDPNKFQLDYYLYILEYLGLKVSNRSPDVYVQPVTTKYDYVFDNRKVVGISFTAAGDLARTWPWNYAVDLVQKLLQNDFKVVFFGLKKDDDYGQYIQKWVKDDRFVNLAGRTTLTEFANLVKKCYFYISVASGGLHLAAASGVKCIGLYCPGDEVCWRPYGENAMVLTYYNISCAPCNQHKMKHCRNNKCMQMITPDEVYEKIVNL